MPGTGLVPSIVQASVALHGASIALSDSPLGGLRLAIDLLVTALVIKSRR